MMASKDYSDINIALQKINPMQQIVIKCAFILQKQKPDAACASSEDG